MSFLTVKFHSRQAACEWERYFPGGKNTWGSCRFVFDRDCLKYDWLVAYDDLAPNGNERFSSRKEVMPCSRKHSLLITSEPSSIKTYGKDFLEQFGYVLTGQEDWAIQHPGKIRQQPALAWFYGRERRYTFDEMMAQPPVCKPHPYSTVCSSKQSSKTLHQKRFHFTEELCQKLPTMARFGHGIRGILDKADALDLYRCHLAVENHICDHWWTEKLSDAFLGLTLPFYFGAPNTAAYFPQESFVPIDINDVESTVAKLQQAEQEKWWEKRVAAILESRRLILEEYNIFATLSRLIELRHDSSNRGYGATIYSRHAIRKASPLAAIRQLYEKQRMIRLQRKYSPKA